MALGYRNCAAVVAGFLTLAANTPGRADQTIADNLIVQGNVTVDEGFLSIESQDSPSLYISQIPGTYTPWDYRLGGNEQSFFLHDITSDTFPFVVESGSPDDALHIAYNGFTGFGTLAPAAPLHALVPAATGAEIVARFEISDDPVGRLLINNNSASNAVFHPRIQGIATSQATPLSFEGAIDTDAGANPCISFNAVRSAGGAVTNRPLVIFRNNVTVRARLAANGDFFATSFSPLSTRTRKSHIAELESAPAQEALRSLTPVEFLYKDDETQEPRLGFIAEDVPELVANSDRQSVPIMDVVALVTRVVKDQQQTLQDQRVTIETQQQALDKHGSTIDRQAQLIQDQRQTLETQAQAISELTRRLSELESRMTTSTDK